MSNLYGVLGLTTGADPGQVKAAFHALAKSSHPDVNTRDASAAKRFKKINDAYEILSDPQKRAVYDLGLRHERAQTRWRFWNTMVITTASFTITVGCGLYFLLHHGGRQVAQARETTAVPRSSRPTPQPNDLREPGERSPVPILTKSSDIRKSGRASERATTEHLPTSEALPPPMSEPPVAERAVTPAAGESGKAFAASGLPLAAPIRQAKSEQATPSTAEPPVEARASAPTTDQPEKTTAATEAPGAVPTIPEPQAERAQALHFYALGMERIGRGDVAAARSLFLLAARKGSVRSMRALAGTYDPAQLAELKVLGMSSNFDAAREWYEKVGDHDAITAAEQVAREEAAAEELRKMSKPAAGLAQFRAAYLSGEGLAYVAVNDETGEQIYRYGDPSRSKAKKHAQTYALFLCDTPYVFTPRKAEDLAALLRATVVSPGDPEFGDLDAKYLSACPGAKSAIPRN
jgi:hypothetical protein